MGGWVTYPALAHVLSLSINHRNQDIQPPKLISYFSSPGPGWVGRWVGE